jgi:catechol 2,3-dioxygenase-like lactoylglutathione lyase family enzyme
MRSATTTIDPATMLKDAPIFSSFAVKDIDAARRFYGKTLGLDVRDGQMGTLEIHGGSDGAVFVYPKPDHTPASFTVLNIEVRDVDEAVDALTGAGIAMEQYNGEGGVTTDARGIARDETPGDGPGIAWFKDPSGNIVSVLEGRSS